MVHFFFRARFAPFCARFARFRARFAQNSWIIFDHIRRHQVQNVNITHVKADRIQGAILCFLQSLWSNFVMQPCRRLTNFRHGFFSADSPMYQIASSPCTSFHGLAMFQTFHSMWNESDFRPGGGIRCKYLKTKACIQAWMETSMSSTFCAAALLVD